MFLRREGVENTEVYGGVDAAGTNFHLLVFLNFSVPFLGVRSLRFHCNSPALLAFMGDKVLAVIMSLYCTSPQGGTRNLCVSLCVS